MAKPLFEALSAFAAERRVSYHMPGSRGGSDLPEGFRAGFARFETTELPQLDDQNEPEGAVLEAERLAARFYGAGRSFFFSSGSTMAIYSMLAAACPPGSRLLCDPASHRSLAQAAALLDLRLDFLPRLLSGKEGRSLIGSLDLNAAAASLETAAFSALYLTRPDYYGRAEPIAPLIRAARARGVRVLVDEAHGAHYAALPENFPASALQLGADLVVQSAHKTLPVLAPASLLHLSPKAAEDEALCRRIRSCRRLFQTSSPSFPIAASLDAARERMETEAFRELNRQRLRAVRELRRELPKPFFLHEAGADEDPFRLLISHAACPLPLNRIHKGLTQRGIDIEMADPRRLLLITTADQSRDDDSRLLQALRELAAEGKRAGAEERKQKERELALEASWQGMLCRRRRQLRPRRAYFSALFSEGLSLAEAEKMAGEGKKIIAREALAPYPPGIPLFYPGEELDGKALAWCRSALAAGLEIGPLNAESPQGLCLCRERRRL